METLSTFYYWAAEQPMFVQVALGIALFVIGLILTIIALSICIAIIWAILKPFLVGYIEGKHGIKSQDNT